MMTYEEALVEIKRLISENARSENFHTVNSLIFARDALEKEIPDEWMSVDPFWDGVDEYEVWKCPKCRLQNYKPTRYCPYCGQKLDRGDKDA